MTTNQILTLSEAAALIRVSQKTLGELARSNQVPAQKVGREWRFLRSALETWLLGHHGPVLEPPHDATATTVANGRRVEEPRAAGFGDTAFSENHKRRLHRWVPWIAGFSSSFVAEALNNVRRTQEPLQVLDPFAGVGTTLVEAIQNGDNAIGFEINPYAAQVCKAKARAKEYDVDQLATAIERFDDFGENELWLLTSPVSTAPPGFRSRVPLFSPDIEAQVLACLDFMDKEPSPLVRELFQIAFGSVMISFSNYSYEPSLGTRAAAGKPNIEQADVFGIVKGKLWDIHEDIVDFQADLCGRLDAQTLSATVHPVSYMDNPNLVPPRSVDIIVTSPPYLNNYHYIRNTRPHLFWLGMVNDSSELKAIEHKSFGQFWQTVRTGPEIPLRPNLPHLAEQIQVLRERNVEKGPYGGPGWANYAASYFNDCYRFCKITRPLMKQGGTVVVVLGNNILQGVEFKTDRLFVEIAEMEGFEVVEVHEVRTKRTGNSVVNSSVRSGTVSKATRLYEVAIELRVP